MEVPHVSENIKINTVSEGASKGVFQVEGLYRGYGTTIGNALRRVLLSSLPGAAITRFKVKGVGHEFTTVPGVLEDVVEIGLNLKQVRFKFFANEPQVLVLSVKGEKEVTAADIKSTTEVQVQNPDLHIATLTSKIAELDMEITVEKGLGYVPVEAQKAEKLSIGTIALDAIYSPVKNVNFSVENMRVGEYTDYNRLTLEIETDGTVSPSDALHKAANVLLDHFSKISAMEVKEFASEEGVAKVKKEPKARAKKAKAE
ncbi:MAG: DNA-directed RNA polymerase subunit alpha [Patescibacteria group bacterium]|nr:DNA-directed RNA polymerase subunit alpha [Patescibacteria group bacterium]MCL5224404.1 DNA-directed RNA polymerase subunit alpha [Patescibacteria group bacterium]